MFDQQVSRMEVSMDPNGRAVENRRPEGRVPRRSQSVGIEHAVQACDCGAGGGVTYSELNAAARIVRTRDWPAAWIDSAQRGDELRQVGRGLARQIRNALDGRVLARQPSAY